MGSASTRPTAAVDSPPPPNRFHVSKVAIVGAGPCGLAAAKYLKAQGAFESIVIFEQQDEVGGVWHYSNLAPPECPVPQQDPFYGPEPPVWPYDGAPAPTFPSPMYNKLHANIPGSLMGFSDQKFPKDSWLFPRREVIQQYLVQYAEDVRDLVKFCFQVKQIALRTEDGRDRWLVEAASTVNDDDVFQDTFDAVVVANGHYSTPYIPAIKNIQQFHKTHPSVIEHSKKYRKAGAFADKKVVVVGNGPSGLDIALQVNQVSRGRTLLSVRHATTPDRLEHIRCEEVAEIDEFLVEQRGVRLKDGRVETDIDHVVFCTGFLYGYPFFPPNLQHKLITVGRGVHGLYRHLFLIQHPTLVFPGLNMRAVPWPLSEAQAAVLSAVWSNNLELPPAEEMEKWSKELEESQGESLHVFQPLADGYYINEFHDWAMKASRPGKEPPRWDDELFWERKIYAEAKLRFERQGCNATTLEELGFHYDPENQDPITPRW